MIKSSSSLARRSFTLISEIKVALLFCQEGKHDKVQEVKEKYGVTSGDLDNFISHSASIVGAHLDKEASLLRNIVEMNLINNPKLPMGLAAPGVLGAIVDGYLINRFLEGKKPKNVVEKATTTNN